MCPVNTIEEILIEMDKINNKEDIQILAFAAQCGRLDLVRVLMRYPEIDVNERDPLALASIHGYIEIVKTLLRDDRVTVSEEAVLGSATDDILLCFLRDPRVNKKDIIKASKPEKKIPGRIEIFGFPKLVKTTQIKKLLLKSRLRMMVVYSSLFPYGLSILLKARILSFLEPYTDEELVKFGLFIEQLEEDRRIMDDSIDSLVGNL